MITRKEMVKAGVGLAAIIAAGKAPASLVRSMLGMRNAMMAGNKPTAKPYKARLEYLESSGTQYIDTGLNADSSLGYEIDAQIMNADARTDQPMGVLQRSPLIRHHMGLVFTVDPHIWCILLGKGTTFVADKTVSGSERLTFKVDTINKTASVGSVSGSWSGVADFDTNLSFYLFGRHDSRSDKLIAAKIWAAKFYINGTLVADLIPVLDNADTPCMYDEVSGEFFYNKGTGEFIAGPLVDEVEYTAKDYVQDGLVAMWDGIENAGYGVHDANAAEWVDLTGGGADWLLRTPSTTVPRFEVGADYIKILRDISWSGVGHCIPHWVNTDFVTAEIVLDMADFAVDNSVRLIVCVATTEGGNPRGALYTHGGYLMVGYGKHPKVALADTTAVSLIYEDSKVFVNGSSVTTSTGNVGPFVYAPPVLSAYAGSPAIGMKIKTFRFYNRVLTAAEIAHNYKIDKARFNLPDST